jgi:hypothetical protein
LIHQVPRDGRELLIVRLIDTTNVEHVDSMVTSQKANNMPRFQMRRKVNKLPDASSTRHSAFSTAADNQSDSEGF